MSFNNIAGHERQKNYLKECLKNNKIFQSLVFAGASGTGKKLVAKEFAKALNCTNLNPETSEPCEKCINCKQNNMAVHPDVTLCDFNYQASLGKTEAERDPLKQQEIKVDTVRSLLLTAQQRPTLGKWQIIIIDQAEKLNKNAANALLKMLEEPPSQTVWILISASGETLLPTIKSRAQIVTFAPLNKTQTAQVLERNGLTPEEAEFYGGLGEGSAGRALQIKELLENIEGLDRRSPTFEYEVTKTFSKTLATARKEAGLYLELLILMAGRKWSAEHNLNKKEQILNLINKLFTYRGYLARNVSPSVTLELALMQSRAENIAFPLRSLK